MDSIYQGSTASHPTVHRDRKSTRLNSSHLGISYAVFCVKKKINRGTQHRFVNAAGAMVALATDRGRRHRHGATRTHRLVDSRARSGMDIIDLYTGSCYRA